MPNGTRSRRLLLIVDQDLDFVEDMRLLLRGERLLSARSLDEAVDIAEGGRVEAAVLGPSFGHEAGVVSAAELLRADPSLAVILVSNVLTTRVLRAALRVGLLDVIETPVTIRKLQAALGRLPAAPEPGNHVAIDDEERGSSVWDASPRASSALDERQSAAEPLGRPAPVVGPATDRSTPAPVPEPAVSPEQELRDVAPEPISSGSDVAESAGPREPGVADGVTPLADRPDAWAIPVPEIPFDRSGSLDPSGPSTPSPAPPVEPAAEGPVEGERIPGDAPGDAEAGGMVELTLEPIPEPTPAPPEHAAYAPPSPRHSPLRRPPPEPEPEPLVKLPKGAPPMPSGAPPMPGDPSSIPDAPRVRRSERDVGSPDPGGVVDDVFGPERPRRVRQPGDGRVVAVMAGKGGSGKTVVAVNLAVALLGALGGESVALVDADLQFGDVALLLQLDPSVTIADVAARSEGLSPEKLDSLLTRHASGLRVLPAPLIPSRAAVAPKQVVRVIEQLQRSYEYVIVDTSAVFDETLIAVLDAADDVLVVVDMDIPSVKNAKIALDTLRSADYPMDRMHLVINRVNSKSRLDVIEVERSLGMRLSASLPSDRVVPQSVNEGIPVVALSPRSRVARAFRELVRLVVESPSR